jgi:hypothetical protein
MQPVSSNPEYFRLDVSEMQLKMVYNHRQIARLKTGWRRTACRRELPAPVFPVYVAGYGSAGCRQSLVFERSDDEQYA